MPWYNPTVAELRAKAFGVGKGEGGRRGNAKINIRTPSTATAPYTVFQDPTAAAFAARGAAGAPAPAPAPMAPPPVQAGGVDPYAEAFQQQQDREDQLAEASMGLVGLDDDKQVLGQELGYADEDVNTAMPEGRQVGRVFVNANPLEFIGAAAKQIRGRKERDEVLGKIKGVNTTRKGLISGIIGALRSKGKKAPAGVAMPGDEGWTPR